MRGPWGVVKEAGRWITIGGSKGEGGKRSGGSPVYVVNGRITRGHPSLTGRKLDNLGDDSDVDHGSTRSQLNSSRYYARAVWRKQAREAGHDPKALDDLADEIKAHHDAFANERKELLQFARQYSKNNFGVDLSRRGKDKQAAGHEDAAYIRGFDQTTEATRDRFPHHFHEESGEHGGHDDQLHAMLTEGHPDPLHWDDAYKQALDVMGEPGKHDDPSDVGDFNFGANVEDEIPKRFAGPWVTKAATSSFTGQSFGRYYINGQQVDRSTYLSQRGGKATAKPKGRTAPAKLTIQDAASKLSAHGYQLGAGSFDHASKQTTYEVATPDGRKVPMTAGQIKDLVSGKGKGRRAKPVAAKPTAPAPTDPRHNPDLDEAMGMTAKPTPTATPSNPSPASKPQAAPARPIPANRPANAKPGPRDSAGRPVRQAAAKEPGSEWDRPAGKAATGKPVPPAAKPSPPPLPKREGSQPPPLPSKATPPALPHQRTQQAALDHANAVVAASRSGDRQALATAHAKAKVSLQQHLAEGLKAIDRMAAERHGDNHAARLRSAQRAKTAFRAKVTAVHNRLLQHANGVAKSFSPWAPTFDLTIGEVE